MEAQPDQTNQNPVASASTTSTTLTLDPNQLLAYIQGLELQIRGLQNQSTNRPSRELEPSKPQAFGGRLGESIDTWIFNVEQYFLLVQVTDDKKIPFAASYLTENAATWWRHVYDENQRGQTTWNWTDFTLNIRTQF